MEHISFGSQSKVNMQVEPLKQVSTWQLEKRARTKPVVTHISIKTPIVLQSHIWIISNEQNWMKNCNILPFFNSSLLKNN